MLEREDDDETDSDEAEVCSWFCCDCWGLDFLELRPNPRLG